MSDFVARKLSRADARLLDEFRCSLPGDPVWLQEPERIIRDWGAERYSDTTCIALSDSVDRRSVIGAVIFERNEEISDVVIYVAAIAVSRQGVGAGSALIDYLLLELAHQYGSGNSVRITALVHFENQKALSFWCRQFPEIDISSPPESHSYSMVFADVELPTLWSG